MPLVVALALALVAAGLLVRFRWYRLDRAPARPEALSPLLSIALAIGVFMLGAIGARAAVGVAGLDPADIVSSPRLRDQATIALGAAIGQSIAAAVYCWCRWVAPGPGRDPRLARGRAALVGVAALAIGWPLVNAAGFVAAAGVELAGGPPPDTIAHDTLRALLTAPRDAWFALTIVLVLGATPALEELLYRGLLQEALRRMGLGPWTAIALTSAVFAAMHVGNSAPHAVAGLFVLSLAFGWAFERTGRLTAPIVMHVVFNAGNLLIALATPALLQ